MKRSKVMVALSGGVDSSVAAALLKEQGHDVAGVTMDFGLSPVDDARRVCGILGIEHHVLDYKDALGSLVIDGFVKEYSKGRTPNPCVRCNRYLKFGRLFQDVLALGATHLATGHYAINQDGLRKARDPHKDQTYFLYGIPRERLPLLMFPLGGYTKDEVRALAARFGLPVAEKKDSQDVCFIPGGKYQDFLIARAGLTVAPGDFVDHQGKVVGQHKGVFNYTIGQREGLGIALGVPVYVNRIDPTANTVHVGPQELLFSCGLEASGLNLLSGNFSKETIEAGVKIRYNQNDIRATVTFMDDGRFQVFFKEPQKAVTPGQSVVIYDEGLVLGGGVIDRAV